MRAVPLHAHEGDRLASLRSYPLEQAVDDPVLRTLVRSAARALDASSAALTVVDADHQRVLVSADQRTDEPVRGSAPVLPREQAFCAYTVAGDAPFVIPDTTADARFEEHPLVTGGPQWRSYLGVPLRGRDGLPLGTVCITDTRPRTFTATDVTALGDIARAAVELLELRRLEVGAGLGGRDVVTEGARLRAGLDAGQLRVHHQPVVHLSSGRIAGVEALVRWQHPEHGLLPPAAFVPVAEASGLVVPMGRTVLGQACQQVATWRATVPGAEDLRVAVNVSGRQLAEPDSAAVVETVLQESALPPSAITLELTETTLFDAAAVQPALRRLRQLGVRLSLDDFGTGYSSLAYLSRFSVDEVKIDRTFVNQLTTSTRHERVVAAAVDLAHSLGCEVVAEGVETAQQYQHVRDLGCEYAQGFWISAPRSADDLGASLLSRRFHGWGISPAPVARLVTARADAS